MFRRTTRWMSGFGFLAALILGAGAGDAGAQEKKAQKPSEKRLAFSANDMPWGKVLKWLSDQTGLPVITQSIPQGTFNFIAPKTPDGKAREYTIPQVIDILNRALLAGPPTQRYRIIREEDAFLLYPADEPLPFLARTEIKDLPNRGKTEMVSIVMTLKAPAAAEMRDAVKKLMGPFGDVVVIEPANQLLMQDTAGNLTHIVKMIQDSQKDREKEAAVTYKRIDLLTLDAPATAKFLTKVFGDPKTGAPLIEAYPDCDSLFVKGTAKQVEQVEEAVGGPNRGVSKTMRIIKLDVGQSAICVGEELQRLLRELRGIDVKIVVPGGDEGKKK
jgi:type II secretory pathway component GspD/PulD (secretin)